MIQLNNAEQDQILADVKASCLAALETFLGSPSDRPLIMPEYLDAVVSRVVRDGLLKHHERIWPYSSRVGETRSLLFGGVLFTPAFGRPVWEPSVREVAFVPEPSGCRVETQFGIELEAEAAPNVKSVRLYPPRMEYAFEFQQQTVVEVVRCACDTGWEWASERMLLPDAPDVA